MKVHLFGATSSSGCWNIALKATAEENEEEFGSAEAATFLRNEFYVDDDLTSTPSFQEAMHPARWEQRQNVPKGEFSPEHFLIERKKGYRIHWMRGSRWWNEEVGFGSLCRPDRNGARWEWCVENDVFQFRVTLKDRLFIRRGVLAPVSSIYDPPGFVAPVLLNGKWIIEQLCNNWDDLIPEKFHVRWERWRANIHGGRLLTLL